MALTKDEKTKIVVEYGKGETDTGSTEVQIALLTQRIHQLTDHLKAHTHDQNSKRGLLKLVGQRRRHLRYLSQKDPDAYREILQRLGLRR